MWVATNDLPRTPARPFYTRLNQIFYEHDFDVFVEGLCQRFYADDGPLGLPPSRHFRLLLMGYCEGWTRNADRVADSRLVCLPRVSRLGATADQSEAGAVVAGELRLIIGKYYSKFTELKRELVDQFQHSVGVSQNPEVPRIRAV
jgi:hypothetical protein